MIRDGSAALVLRQQARRQPEEPDGFMAMGESSGGMPSLSLQGARTRSSAARATVQPSAVPLRVAWVSGADAEEPKNVVLRVFETPDRWK